MATRKLYLFLVVCVGGCSGSIDEEEARRLILDGKPGTPCYKLVWGMEKRPDIHVTEVEPGGNVSVVLRFPFFKGFAEIDTQLCKQEPPREGNAPHLDCEKIDFLKVEIGADGKPTTNGEKCESEYHRVLKFPEGKECRSCILMIRSVERKCQSCAVEDAIEMCSFINVEQKLVVPTIQ